jgi:tetratricopeptide (TPR) repeat protein
MHMLRDTSIALCGLAFAGALFAAPADDIKALLDKGDARSAYELGKKHPDQLGNPAFDFYFGVAAIDSGRAGEGVLALERYLANFPDNVQARAELARGYFVLGENARAREEFREVLKAKPPAAVVANIERYLDAIRARESAYRTTAGAFLELGLGYDSNINGGVSNANLSVPNLGQITVLPAGVKIGSSFAQATAGANIVHPVAPGVALFGSVGADVRTNNNHQEFDQGNLGAAGGVSYLLENDLLRASVSFNTLDVDHQTFRDVTAVTGEWTRQLDELQAVSAFLQYADLDYKGSNDPRDSNLYGIGGGYRRAFVGPGAPLLSLGASYAQENNRRDRDDLARDIWSLRAAVSATPAPRWAVSAGATFQLSDYDAADPLFATTRRDRYYAADFTASYAFTRNFSVRGEVLLSRNDSNIALFEYQRDVAAIKVRYDFK